MVVNLLFVIQAYSLASESFAKHIFHIISVLQSNGKCNTLLISE